MLGEQFRGSHVGAFPFSGTSIAGCRANRHDRPLHRYGSAMLILSGTDRSEAIVRLKAHEGKLKQLGVEHLYLFDSTARGEARPDSDVDLFFGHPVGSVGLHELIDLKENATRILGCRADSITRRNLHGVLRKRIEAPALQVF